MQPSLALIGIGYWGKNLARNFYALGALHTICDVDETALRLHQQQYPGVTIETQFSKVLQNPEIERVAIAAPAIQHYALAKQVLLAGKDVYIEKPICLDVREGEELIALAQQQKRILMVGHLLHYHPCFIKLQELVSQGALGRLQYIVSNRLNLGKIRTEENALWNFAPHDVSVILSLCGNRLPEQVRCFGEAYVSRGVVDTSLTTLRFSDDLRAHIYVSWLNPFKEQKLTVVGSDGMVVFDDTKPWAEKLSLYRQHITWTQGNIPSTNSVKPELVIVPESEPLRTECAHFLECCVNRTTPRTDGHEALRVLRVLHAAQASLDENGIDKNPGKAYAGDLGSTPYYVHPTALVDPEAEVGAGTKIWHFSHIMNGAVVGPNCNIGQNVVVSPGVKLGRNVKVQNNVSLYTGVQCEEDVFLGPSCVFTNVNNPRAAVSRRHQYEITQVRRGVSVGANATIICGHELGAYCFIGAGAVVTKNVKPFALMVGNPARQIGWMSRYGERLDLPVALPAGESCEAACPTTGEVYRLEGDILQLVCEATLEKV